MNQTGTIGKSWTARKAARVGLCVLVAVAVALLGACSSKPRAGRYTVEVMPTQSVSGQAFDVDLFGVASDTDYRTWGSDQVEQHFAGGALAAARADRKPVTLHWEAGDSQPKRLEAGDPMWNAWLDKGAWYLVVATDSRAASATGGQRVSKPVVLPLDVRRWKTKVIRVELGSSGLQLVTRMEPLPE